MVKKHMERPLVFSFKLELCYNRVLIDSFGNIVILKLEKTKAIFYWMLGED